MRQFGRRLVAEGARHVDDGAPRCTQVRNGGRGKQARTEHIDREDIHDPIGCRIDQRKDRAGAGVIDQSIYPAPEIDCLGDRAAGIFGRGRIRNKANEVRMLGNRFLERARTAAGYEHLVALSRES